MRVVRVVGMSCGILALAASVAFAQQAPPGAPRGGGAPGGAPQQMNLKALPKTWTGQQVRTLMQTFTESLGVQCAYCHSADPNAAPPAAGRGPALDYALDGKEEKETTRKMIAMTMAINADSLKGIGDAAAAEKVSCFTCHNGAEKPAQKPAAGWARGNFSLLPAGPTAPPRAGGPGPGAPPAPAPGR